MRNKPSEFGWCCSCLVMVGLILIILAALYACFAGGGVL